MIWRTLMLLVAGALLAVGCRQSTLRTPEADRVVREIESGRHRRPVSPTCLLSTRKKLFSSNEDVRVAVRVVAPTDGKVLDPYLPIKGRFHVKLDGAIRELRPLQSSLRLVWAEIPLDDRRERERSFTQVVNKLFPMDRLGWYTIWWAGRDDVGQKVVGGKIHVRVMAKVPK